ncbi:MAG: hypothetical protein H7Y11_04040 [Armatimonadetes bacterium]|nr:hypothetical protein [Anaerolineae bacterium]
MKHTTQPILIALVTTLAIVLSACGGQAASTDIPATAAAVISAATDAPDLPSTAVPPAATNAVITNFTPGPELQTLIAQGQNLTSLPPPTYRPTIEGELVYGDPRTLVTSKTEDPDAAFPFTSLRLERNGGQGSTPTDPPNLTIEIREDGQVTRNGVAGTMSQATLDALNNQLREINFYGISGDYLGILSNDSTQDYRYYVVVARNGSTASINARDGFMPQEITQLISTIITEVDTIR